MSFGAFWVFGDQFLPLFFWELLSEKLTKNNLYMQATNCVFGMIFSIYYNFSLILQLQCSLHGITSVLMNNYFKGDGNIEIK